MNRSSLLGKWTFAEVFVTAVALLLISLFLVQPSFGYWVAGIGADSKYAVINQTGYSISGRITTSDGTGVAGVLVTATQTIPYPSPYPWLNFSATTDNNGYYTVNGIPDIATYTITPSYDNGLFSPTSRNLTVTGAMTGQDFTVNLSYSISGRIATSDGTGVAGVVVTARLLISNPYPIGVQTLTAVTNSNGDYTITGVPLNAVSGSLTPTCSGYIFEPSSNSITVDGVMTGQDFMAEARIYLPLTLKN